MKRKKKEKYRPCSGIKSSDRGHCHHRGIFKRKKHWWCRVHDPERKKRKGPKPISVSKLKRIRSMVCYYEAHGKLGSNVDFEKLWADIVPNLLREILTLRKIK